MKIKSPTKSKEIGGALDFYRMGFSGYKKEDFEGETFYVELEKNEEVIRDSPEGLSVLSKDKDGKIAISFELRNKINEANCFRKLKIECTPSVDSYGRGPILSCKLIEPEKRNRN
jgi:hypothetical protein